MSDPATPTKNRSTGTRALLSTVGVIILLLVLVPRPTIALPLAGIAVIVGLVYLMHRSFRWGRAFGLAVCGVVLLAVVGVSATVIHAQQTHSQLLEKLAQYRYAEVGREFWPYPYVDSLSVSGSVDDEDLRKMLEMPELEHLERLSLKSDNLTDACFQDVERIQNLQQLFINGLEITDKAILAFERNHPECRVIAFGRDLHAGEHEFEVIGMERVDD